MNKVKVLAISIVVFLISISVFAQKRNSAEFELSKNLSIYHNILKELNILYVDSIDNEKLIKIGIEEMLKTLDPYTVYIPESNVSAFKTHTTGEYGGIGALVGRKGDYVMLAEIYEGFPADKAGLRAGDRIICIDNKDLKGKSIKEVTSLMKGKQNTSFTATIERPYSDGKPFDLVVKREKIQLDCVPYDSILDGNIGYIIFSGFTTKAEKRLKETIKKLKKQGATSLIVDLRGNPGGLLDQAVKVVNLFIPKGETVVFTKSKVAQLERKYQTTKSPLAPNIPIVLLVNRSSASAAEIFSGTLQDLDRGVVVGTHSYGKGLVQATRSIGYNNLLKLTTSKYYIASGRCIQALDYTHRNKDGSVGYVPDSLISAFKTRNGRTVYDGGGIMPDVKIEGDTLSSLTSQLLTNYKIFDFANWYANNHPKVGSDFVVNDNLYNKFVNFIDTADFDYQSKSYLSFKELRKALKKDKKEETEAIKQLEKELHPKLKEDLVKNKQEIKTLLEYSIIKRSLYQKGGYAKMLKNDKVLKKAVEILKDPRTYKGMLDGSIPVDSNNKKREKKDDA